AVVVIPEGPEKGRAETSTLDGLEELFGDNGISINVCHWERSSNSLEDSKCWNACATTSRSLSICRFLIHRLILETIALLLSLRNLSLGGYRNLRLAHSFILNVELTDIGKLTSDGSSGGHGGGNKMRPPLGTLTTLKIAV